MQKQSLPFKQTGYFSQLICDYLDQKTELNTFYNNYPNLSSFKKQIEEKQKGFNKNTRLVLVESLKRQYAQLNTSDKTLNNIDLLKEDNTFTVTTGHQLNLFTGPLYFLYKIVATINLTEQLKKEYKEQHFVPVYWMATEDHDFDEINYFNFKGKKVVWNKAANGAVGELLTNGLDAVFNVFSTELGSSKNAEALKQLFKRAYLEHSNLAEATHFLVNELFKDFGLVIIDANQSELKRLFIPYIKEELIKQTAFNEVNQTNEALVQVSDVYKIQVNPREINLFYLNKNLRERIVLQDEVYKVLNTDITWSKSEILKHLEEAPERFSPNVIMRPLYQEVILPNLCYIGGGGELAYWFQLKDFFTAVNVPFPILLLRNSVLLQSNNQQKKLEKLNISTEHLFLKKHAFINKRVRDISNVDIDLSPQKEHLVNQFKDLYTLAEKTDKSFIGAVKAQEIKQIKGLEALEKRLLQAQKRKLKDEVERATTIKNELFPNESLQERYTNFSEIYLEYGDNLIKALVSNLEPLKSEFLIITL
ncbi:bacillithiol biosynthesis cysteine-adding enzyme BshC [Neotamlana laminarinivorans]|uniref:Putative cysteine ligase BshC n=1 Tax=Neotamlana laminarinivorans TaxID=2883124 RepID=A0A9X1I1B0_9FLAO|nr:bacillithiol biosynthesis cysteine-adding enzyme BshC [Tamlana laminarinivorans]MCB4799984.1 bacillithiol biosynthesis cysteine-adding enzyme BshC [Tamlana laminarinivorans]